MRALLSLLVLLAGAEPHLCRFRIDLCHAEGTLRHLHCRRHALPCPVGSVSYGLHETFCTYAHKNVSWARACAYHLAITCPVGQLPALLIGVSPRSARLKTPFTAKQQDSAWLNTTPFVFINVNNFTLQAFSSSLCLFCTSSATQFTSTAKGEKVPLRLR